MEDLQLFAGNNFFFSIKSETLGKKKKKIRERSYELLVVAIVVVVASIDISTDPPEESFQHVEVSSVGATKVHLHGETFLAASQSLMSKFRDDPSLSFSTFSRT